MTTMAKNLAAEILLLLVVFALVVAIAVLAALHDPVPSSLNSLALALGGAGAGVTVPAVISKVIAALSSVAPPASSSSTDVTPGGPRPAPSA